MFHMSDKALKDSVIIIAILLVSFFLFGIFDVLEAIVAFANTHENLEIDELLSTAVVFSLCMLWYSWQRLKETEAARIIAENKTVELEKTLSEVRTLQGIIPTCCYCNSIRDDKGAWGDLQSYINTNLDAKFSHGVCPECLEKRIEEIENDEEEVSA